MSLLDLHGPDIAAAAPLYVPPAPKPRRAWGEATALFRGAGEGLTQIGASIGAVLAQGDSAVGSGLEPNPLMGTDAGRMVSEVGAERRRQRDRDIEAIRAGGRSLRPDEAASTAEQLLYGAARSITKVVGGALAGGVPGILAVSAEEAFTQTGEAQREGIDSRTAAALGLVQGAGLALAALPAAGQTFAGTAALYAAGGPGGFIAQQALTKEILDRAGYAQRAQQVDVLDPVGLAVSALVPAPFAVLGLRAARNRRAFESLPDLPPRDAPAADGGQATAAAMSELPPFERTATAQAVEAYPREVTDAALVLNARHADNEAREAMAGGDMAASRAHDTALARAEEQIQRGEPVSVADVASPPLIVGAERDANFRAWFGDSKVVDPEGKPLVMYHGTAASFDAHAGPVSVTADPKTADFYARQFLGDGETSGDGGNIQPLFVKLQNPKFVDEIALQLNRYDPAFVAEAKADGHDGLAPIGWKPGQPARELVVFDANQLKSAIGNSGRFDPTSGSLTDPITSLARDIRAAVDEAAAEMPALRQTLDDMAAASRIAREASQPAPVAPVEPIAPRAAAPQAAEPGTAQAADAAAIADAAPARLADIQQQFPDLTIKLDDGSLVRASEFLEAAKAEAARDAQEADLVDAAVQCALLHGT